MNGGEFAGRRVLVVGERLAPAAQDGLAGASFETAAANPLDALAGMHKAVELVLIDAETADASALASALSAMALAPAPPAVLLAGAHLPASLARALMKLPRSDVLEPPFTAADLARTAAVLLAGAPAPAAASHSARCWTVMGSVGGCGATTIAVELATALARRAPARQRVALVDLHLADGATAAYLGASPNMMLGEAAAPERIDAAVLAAYTAHASPGLDLLAAPRDARAFAKVGPAAVCRLLEVVAGVYDWIVVDLPRHHQPWTLDVLAGSDEVLVVSELTVPALLAARALAGEIEAELPTGAAPKIILNRLASRVFGPAPSLAEAEKALQRKAEGGITSDWEAAAASVNLGGSISHHRPRSKIVRDIAVLVERLADRQPQQVRRA